MTIPQKNAFVNPFFEKNGTDGGFFVPAAKKRRKRGEKGHLQGRSVQMPF
jgi:hypothetical protein